MQQINRISLAEAVYILKFAVIIWEIYVDGELFDAILPDELSEDILMYSVGDEIDEINLEDINDYDITYKGVKQVAEIYIETIQRDKNDVEAIPLYGNEFPNIDLTPEELTELRKQLVIAWAQHFGVSEE